MSSGLYSGQPGLSLGTGLYRTVSSLWSGASGLTMAFGGAGMPLSLDFATQTYSANFNSYAFQSLITFTRSSSATYVDATGKIVSTPASRNLLTFTQEFDNAAWTKTAASITANAATAPDGTFTADVLVEDTTAVSAHRVFTSVSVPAAAYTASIYVKAGTRSWFYIRLTDSGGVPRYAYFNVSTGALGTVETNLTASITSVGNGWYRCSATVNSAATTLPVIFAITDGNNSPVYTGNGTGSLYFWGAQLEAASTATDYTRNNGGVYPPRFDYDPVTLAPRGLLVEEQRTNLVLYSEQFDNAAWGKTATTVTANAIVSPDGTADADKLQETTATATFQIAQSATVVAGQTLTAFVFFKAGERQFGRVLIGGTGWNAYAAFDLSTGAAGSATGNNATGVSASITSVGNGWYRCALTATPPAGLTSANFAISINNSILPNDSTYAGTAGNGLYIWGAQLEAGAFATSYIPTVASQVTRSADVAAITGPNFTPWYNQTAGTFVFEGSSFTVPSFSYLLLASDGTFANRFGIYTSSSSAAGLVVSSSVAQMDISASSIAANVPFKAAVSAQTNSGNFSLNGSIGTTDTAITMPAVSRLTLGAGFVGAGEYINGHVRSLRYYPTRLTNAQLQALTA